MVVKYKKVFLVDSLGALLSAFLLGIVLVEFEIVFGMPKNILYTLSAGAFILTLYSLTIYLFVEKKWSFYLKLIAFVNLIYCCITIGLVTYHFEKITVLGLFYFIAEITIILILASVEFKIANSKIKNQP